MKSIVIIDDNKNFLEMYKMQGEHDGFAVFESDEGDKGIELIKAKQPDIILLDLVMAPKDGYEVLKEIKTNELTAHIPVIVVTNIDNEKDKQAAHTLGAVAYCLKSDYTPKTLFEKVDEVLGKSFSSAKPASRVKVKA
ncbi:MAG: response regulator [Candidatus Spechtbacteria bacterium]|nr:response regulator [Candidatus Spechtbacteria bacterium]